MTAAPVFVIGCPRSGTTLLLDLLAGSGAFGYVTTSGARRDVAESLHGRTRVYDLPLVGGLLYRRRPQLLAAAARLGPVVAPARRRLPAPIEPWEFWEDLLPCFRPEHGDGPALDPGPDQLAEPDRRRAREVVDALLAAQRRDVLLSKYTDFPRIDLIRSVFPAARFVHIRRDAHAVANSYAVEIESGRFGTWRDRDWWAAQWPASARDHWHASGATPLGFAAHNRNRLVALVDDAVARTEAPTLTVAYERLTAHPVGVLRELLAFTAVDARHPLDRLVRARGVASSNDRWRSRRTPGEIALLDEILDPAAPWSVP